LLRGFGGGDHKSLSKGGKGKREKVVVKKPLVEGEGEHLPWVRGIISSGFSRKNSEGAQHRRGE